MDVQRYTIEEKKTNKLPEASFRIIEDYYKSLPDAPPQPSNYHRFVGVVLETMAMFLVCLSILPVVWSACHISLLVTGGM